MRISLDNTKMAL